MKPEDAILTLCEHIRPLAEYLVAQGSQPTYAGTPWSRNCRTWVYFDRVVDCTGAARTVQTGCMR